MRARVIERESLERREFGVNDTLLSFTLCAAASAHCLHLFAFAEHRSRRETDSLTQKPYLT